MKIININETSCYEGCCSNLFKSPEWLKVISDSYKLHFQAVISDDNRYILPFCIVKDRFFVSLKSIPFGDYTLIYCPEDYLSHSLHYLQKLYPNFYIETSVVSENPPAVKDFNSEKYGYLIQIDIQKWKGKRERNESYERNIRHAIHNGLYVKINRSLEGILAFYQLHEHLRINKFKKLPQPVRFFKNIYKEFIAKDKGFILEAWNENKLIASWVIIHHDKTLYYKFGASDIQNLYLRPNDLLFRYLIQYGNDIGCDTIDLGFSGATKSYEGLIRFKSKEGGKKIPIYKLEYFPGNFNIELLENKTKRLNDITQKAINTKDMAIIRETSEKYYGKFV